MVRHSTSTRIMRVRFSLCVFRQSFSWLPFIMQFFKKEGEHLAQSKQTKEEIIRESMEK